MRQDLYDSMIDALVGDTMYDWVRKHYWELSKDTLADILWEYVFAIHQYEIGVCGEDIAQEVLDGIEQNITAEVE